MAAMPWVDERVAIAPADRRQTVLDVIAAARHRLILSLYRCDDRRVLEALAAARRRGVRVEVLLTRRSSDPGNLRLLRLLLERAGIRVWRYGDRHVKYHAKFLVADEGPALVGSANFTRRCFKKTADFMLVTHDPGIVSSLAALFEADCRAPFGGLRAQLSPRLIVAPEQARPAVTALLQQASESIRIIDRRASDSRLLATLAARAAAEVGVCVLRGPRVGRFLSHGKLLIADRRVAVFGSLALSPASLDRRRELSVVVRGADVLRALIGFFDEAAFHESAGALLRQRAESAA